MMVVVQQQKQKQQNAITLYKKDKRTTYEIIYDILTLLHRTGRTGLTRNGMAYRANFVTSQYRIIQEILLKTGLIKEMVRDGRTLLKKPDHVHSNTPYYVITDKGLDFIQRYENMTELLMVDE